MLPPMWRVSLSVKPSGAALCAHVNACLGNRLSCRGVWDLEIVADVPDAVTQTTKGRFVKWDGGAAMRDVEEVIYVRQIHWGRVDIVSLVNAFQTFNSELQATSLPARC